MSDGAGGKTESVVTGGYSRTLITHAQVIYHSYQLTCMKKGV